MDVTYVIILGDDRAVPVSALARYVFMVEGQLTPCPSLPDPWAPRVQRAKPDKTGFGGSFIPLNTLYLGQKMVGHLPHLPHPL